MKYEIQNCNQTAIRYLTTQQEILKIATNWPLALPNELKTLKLLRDWSFVF